MRDLYFENRKELEEFLEDKEKLEPGAEGTCYKIDDYVLKIYNFLIETEVSYYLKFKDIDIEHFTFIKNIAYIKEKRDKYLVGTICKYINGEVLVNKPLYNVPIEEIINGIKRLLPSIKKLSEHGIVTEDVFVGNIIYNEGNFNFIDTASYYYSYEEPYYVYKQNLITIIKELMLSITNSYNSSTISRFLLKTNNEFNYNLDLELLSNPIYLLKGLKQSLEEYCDKELISFSDSESILKKKLNII